MANVVIGWRYAGPPDSGNGGYVAGLVARRVDGPATAVPRAIIPLDSPLDLSPAEDRWRLSGDGGCLIVEASPASAAELSEPPAPPTLHAALAAGLR